MKRKKSDPQVHVFFIEQDGKRQRVETPVLCLHKTAREDCGSQAQCDHGYCTVHCWVRQCKRKRGRRDNAVPATHGQDSFATADDPIEYDQPQQPMDSSSDSKGQAMDRSQDSRLPEQKQTQHVTDRRPEHALESAEALYIAWLNGDRLVTARQSGETVNMILPTAKGSLETWCHLSRTSKQFSDGTCPLWTCDCGKSQHISNLLTHGQYAERRVEAVCKELCDLKIDAPCSHITVGPAILRYLKETSTIPAGALLPVEVLNRKPFVVSVEDSHAPDCLHRVIVRETPHHLLDCSKDRQRAFLCEHSKQAFASAGLEVQSRLRLVQENKDGDSKLHREVKQPAAAALVGDMKCTSGVTVSWPLHLQSIPPGGNLHQPFCCLHTSPCLTECKCAGSTLTVTQAEPIRIYGVTGLRDAVAYSYKCSCGEELPYSPAAAAADELFVIQPGKKGSKLYLDFRLLVQYDLQFSRSGTTFRAFCRSQRDAYAMQAQQFISKPQFVNAWWQWNRARRLDFDTAYGCKTCLALPPEQRVYVIDVTRLGIKKKFLSRASCAGCKQNAQTPLRGWLAVCLTLLIGVCIVYFSQIEQRVLIRDKDARELLLAYAQATEKKPLSKKDAMSLRRKLQGEHWVSLFRWIDTDLSKGATDFFCFPPPALSRLLEAIAKPSQLPGFILRPAEMVPVLQDIAASPPRVYPRTSPRVLSLLQDNCPALYQLLHSELCKNDRGEFNTFPIQMKALIKWLADSCDNIVRSMHATMLASNPVVVALPADEQKAPPDVNPVSIDDDWKLGSFFGPSLRFHRHLRVYAADGEKVSKDADGSECYREPESQRQLTHGIFTVHCPHGVCHGWTLLHDPESEKHAFEAFFTRLNHGRAIIVYDRACKLHTYALRREPAFFYNTVFRVDILHFVNHTACSEGYNPRIYRSPSAMSKEANAPFANTQVAEQYYARIAALRTAFAFMTQQHAQEFIRTFIGMRNLDLQAE